MSVAPPIPANEEERLRALMKYAVLDTPPEKEIDDLARIASQICGTPVSMVSLIDADRQWFKSKVGPVAVNETSRDVSFCGHAILQDDVFVVTDAAHDARFSDNPLVTGEMGVRFYAGAPLIDPEGNALGSLCVVDTTPRELTDEQREALKALSRQVVVQFELRRTAQELGKALRQKGEFLRIASHDLKNPLTVVSVAAKILERKVTALAGKGTAEPRAASEEESDDLRRLLTTIARQGETMKKLVEDYLDSQALEDGRLAVEKSRGDFNRVAKLTVEDLEGYADSKGTTVALELDETLGEGEFDGARVARVMSNLVGNAIKFSPPGARVTIRTRGSAIADAESDFVPEETARGTGADNGAPFLLFEVRDQGPGLSDDDMKRVFGDYGKLSARPTGEEKSSGLGLAICRKLVELHGGRIGVRNNRADDGERRGATFWFTVPRGGEAQDGL